jgi:hypothetical protein
MAGTVRSECGNVVGKPGWIMPLRTLKDNIKVDGVNVRVDSCDFREM